jgi:hypothetical protein
MFPLDVVSPWQIFHRLRPLRVTRGRRSLRINSIVQNNVEYQLLNLDSAVVCNKAELAKAIHEAPHAGRVMPIILLTDFRAIVL